MNNCPSCQTPIQSGEIEFCPNCSWELIVVSNNSSEWLLKYLADKLSKSNPEAMAMLKKVFWRGTENWDTLLIERAEISGARPRSRHRESAALVWRNLPNAPD